MASIEAVLYNSLFQAVVLGPIAGVLVGAILSRLFSNLNESSESPNRREEVVIRYIREERHYHHHSRTNSTTSDDASAYMGAAFALSVIATWAFVAYLDYITFSLWSALGFVGAMLVGFFSVSFLRCGINTNWLIELLLAGAFLTLCFWLVSLPYQNLDPELITLAKSRGAIDFYFKTLNDWGKKLVLSQMFGLLFVSLSAFAMMMRGLNILSLAMVNSNEPYGMAVRIVYATRNAGGTSGLFMLVFSSFMAWYLTVAASHPNALIWQLLGQN